MKRSVLVLAFLMVAGGLAEAKKPKKAPTSTVEQGKMTPAEESKKPASESEVKLPPVEADATDPMSGSTYGDAECEPQEGEMSLEDESKPISEQDELEVKKVAGKKAAKQAEKKEPAKQVYTISVSAPSETWIKASTKGAKAKSAEVKISTGKEDAVTFTFGEEACKSGVEIEAYSRVGQDLRPYDCAECGTPDYESLDVDLVIGEGEDQRLVQQNLQPVSGTEATGDEEAKIPVIVLKPRQLGCPKK